MKTPEKYTIEPITVTSETVKDVVMKAAGGFAISIVRKDCYTLIPPQYFGS
jgi:hypothetical protein